MGMQSRDGGWAAFDADNNWAFLNRVPFADHNAMLDPTARTSPAGCSRRSAGAAIERRAPGIGGACEYLLQTQERDGSWYGRWGVNYIYGTFLALRGLRGAGIQATAKAHAAGRQVDALGAERGRRLGRELRELRRGPVRARRRARRRRPRGRFSGCRGRRRARPRRWRAGCGTWSRPRRPTARGTRSLATGTGFPNVFYLRYTLYRNYFPLLALTHARRALEEAERSLRLVQESEPSRPIR